MFDCRFCTTPLPYMCRDYLCLACRTKERDKRAVENADRREAAELRAVRKSDLLRPVANSNVERTLVTKLPKKAVQA